MNKLLDELGIDEKLTKPPPKQKRFNKVKDNIPLVEHYNYQADLLFLPTAKYGYKYLLVMVDIANDEFDIEPLKSKTTTAVLNGTKKIFKRGILKEPHASVRTDSGTEFKGDFKKYMYEKSILLKTSMPDRHKQTANVERLNRDLGRIIMGYLDKLDQDNNKVNKNWLDLIPFIREKLNDIRRKELPKGDKWKTMDYALFDPSEEVKSKGKQKLHKYIEPKFKVGDKVHHVLNRPENAQGQKQHGGFRMGDHRWTKSKKKITQVLLFPGTAMRYRYLLEGIKEASFGENELKK